MKVMLRRLLVSVLIYFDILYSVFLIVTKESI